jgi:hypothetical protein
MPRGTPFFIGKNQVTFQDTIFLLLHVLCVFLGASVVFVFSFLLLCLLQQMFGSHHVFGERHAPFFICQEHSVFHSYRFNECSLFLLLHLAFVFCLDFCSDLVLSFHQGVF